MPWITYSGIWKLQMIPAHILNVTTSVCNLIALDKCKWKVWRELSIFHYRGQSFAVLQSEWVMHSQALVSTNRLWACSYTHCWQCRMGGREAVPLCAHDCAVLCQKERWETHWEQGLDAEQPVLKRETVDLQEERVKDRWTAAGSEVGPTQNW